MRRRSSLIRSAGSNLPVARQHVVGQECERLAFGAWRERTKRPLRGFDELDGGALRVVNRSVLRQQQPKLAPLVERGAPFVDDLADQCPSGSITASEQMNDGKRHLAFAEITADRLAEDRFFSSEIEQIIDQ